MRENEKDKERVEETITCVKKKWRWLRAFFNSTSKKPTYKEQRRRGGTKLASHVTKDEQDMRKGGQRKE